MMIKKTGSNDEFSIDYQIRAGGFDKLSFGQDADLNIAWVLSDLYGVK